MKKLKNMTPLLSKILKILPDGNSNTHKINFLDKIVLIKEINLETRHFIWLR